MKSLFCIGFLTIIILSTPWNIMLHAQEVQFSAIGISIPDDWAKDGQLSSRSSTWRSPRLLPLPLPTPADPDTETEEIPVPADIQEAFDLAEHKRAAVVITWAPLKDNETTQTVAKKATADLLELAKDAKILVNKSLGSDGSMGWILGYEIIVGSAKWTQQQHITIDQQAKRVYCVTLSSGSSSWNSWSQSITNIRQLTGKP